jgi:hypothetical protein
MKDKEPVIVSGDLTVEGKTAELKKVAECCEALAEWSGKMGRPKERQMYLAELARVKKLAADSHFNI